MVRDSMSYEFCEVCEDGENGDGPVQQSPHLCNHCGFAAKGCALVSCTRCGVTAHPSCSPWREFDGICEECRRASVARTVCELCHQRDSGVLPSNSTDRLCKVALFEGYRFAPCEDPDAFHQRADVVFVGASSRLAARLAVNPTTTFRPEELPGEGRLEILVRMTTGTFFASRPLVVHSWCLSALFQLDAKTPDVATRAVDAMNAASITAGLLPGCLPERAACRASALLPCVFCAERRGFLTVCLYHTLSARGCASSRMGDKEHRAVAAFHPSCAVRSGMQRITMHGGIGLACNSTHRQWRAQTVGAGLEPWIDAQPGLNETIASQTVLSAASLAVEAGARRKPLW